MESILQLEEKEEKKKAALKEKEDRQKLREAAKPEPNKFSAARSKPRTKKSVMQTSFNGILNLYLCACVCECIYIYTCNFEFCFQRCSS